MKNKLLIGILAFTLCSCSLLQRHDDEEEETVSQSEEAPEASNAPPLESEVARLNTKISALETKLDVLSSSMERMQMKDSQPVIEAENAAPQPNMAAPVAAGESEDESEASTVQVSSAPARPKELPSSIKVNAPNVTGKVEKEFKINMVLFQNGKNQEASNGFLTLAKKYPQHLLASHALYWSGEASARAQQWSSAMDSWSELERSYPRSAYLPDALAGLSRAYEKQGNVSKAMSYKATLMKAFPKSPVALNFVSSSRAPVLNHASAKAARNTTEEEVPTYQEHEEPAAATEEGE